MEKQFEKHEPRQMPIKQAAHKYRLKQAENLLKHFKADTGRDASSCEELEEWAKRTHGSNN